MKLFCPAASLVLGALGATSSAFAQSPAPAPASASPAPLSVPAASSPAASPVPPATTPRAAAAVPTTLPTPPASTELAPFADAASQARYVEARAFLLAGNFERCVAASTALEAGASTEAERFVAKQQAALCDTWLKRNMVLAHRSRVEDGDESGAPAGRTTGEIVTLYGSAVLYGLGTGLFADVQAESSSVSGFVLPPLLLAGVAVGGVAIADSRGAFRYGVPQSIVTGLNVGFAQGVAWTFWNQARTTSQDEWSAKTVAGVLWGFSTGGAVLGGVLGSRFPTTPGRASYVGSASLWTGSVVGLFAGALTADGIYRDDNAMLGGALGLTAGAAAGFLTATRVSPSINRVRIIDLSALSGAVVFGGLYVAVGGEQVTERTAYAVLGSGIGTGVAIATFATRGMRADRTVQESANASGLGPVASVSPAILPLARGAALGLSGTLF